jgi:spore maturation protein CgeB
VRILLVTSTDVRTSDAPFLLARALERRGEEVRLIPTDVELPFLVGVGLLRGGTADGVYRAGFQRLLLDEARTWGADALFLYGSNWAVDPTTIRRLQRERGCQVALWEVNQRLWRGHQASSVLLYDHVFSLDSHFVPVFEASGVRCVEHLCACADPEEHRPVDLSPGERSWYEADISFVGTQHPDRVKLLEQLDGWVIRIYGGGWGSVDGWLKECVRDEPVYGLKKAKVYAASQITINVHGPHMVSGENFRVYEVAACGRVSFSKFKPDLVKSLEPDVEVVVFDDADDLRKKLDHYLSHPDELDRIAQAGRQRVLSEHTYDHRAAVIMRHLEGGC